MLFYRGRQRVLDANGEPVSGAKANFYLTGTTTRADTYSDAALTIPNTNPVIANSAGFLAPIYLDPDVTYKCVITDSADVALPDGTVDPIIQAAQAALTQSAISAILNPRTDAEGAAGVTPVNYAIPSHEGVGVVLPERYGAVGNGNAADTTNGALDTTAIGKAILIASATGSALYLSRKYIAVPATATTQESIAITVAWVMQSNMHVVGEKGASITLANSQSTDSAVVNLALFHTNSVLSNVSFRGVIFDLNGANNKISPLRPATYNNSYNMAAISVSGTPAGVAARIDDCTIEDCTFKNCPGVCFVLMAQSNSANIVLGKRWTVRSNLFLNGGTDTDDHTSLYGWADFVTVDGNKFWEDSPPHTVGKTGGVSCYEIHGTDHEVTNNLFYNYKIGVRLSTNFTVADSILRTIITDNDFATSYTGVNIERPTAGLATMGIIEIDDNIFYFDDYLITGGAAYKTAINVDNNYSIFDLKVRGNECYKTGVTIPAVFLFADTVGVAAQAYTNFTITDNSINGCAVGVFAQATASSAGFGNLEISRNDFVSLTPDATVFTTSIGISLAATAGIATLILDSNRFIDERGSPAFNKGIVINSGTVTDLWVGPQTYKGLTGTPYSEGGGIAITNRLGKWLTTGVTGAIATAATVTHGLNATPTGVTLTALDGTPTAVFPSAFGATTFTVNYTGGGTHAFSWTAFNGSQQ